MYYYEYVIVGRTYIEFCLISLEHIPCVLLHIHPKEVSPSWSSRGVRPVVYSL